MWLKAINQSYIDTLGCVLQLWAYALVENSKAEEPIELIINLIDQNDNHPAFTQNPYYGGVSEGAEIGETQIKSAWAHVIAAADVVFPQQVTPL